MTNSKRQSSGFQPIVPRTRNHFAILGGSSGGIQGSSAPDSSSDGSQNASPDAMLIVGSPIKEESSIASLPAKRRRIARKAPNATAKSSSSDSSASPETSAVKASSKKAINSATGRQSWTMRQMKAPTTPSVENSAVTAPRVRGTPWVEPPVIESAMDVCNLPTINQRIWTDRTKARSGIVDDRMVREMWRLFPDRYEEM